MSFPRLKQLKVFYGMPLNGENPTGGTKARRPSLILPID